MFWSGFDGPRFSSQVLAVAELCDNLGTTVISANESERHRRHVVVNMREFCTGALAVEYLSTQSESVGGAGGFGVL